MNESLREQIKRLNRAVSRTNLPSEERTAIYRSISEAVATLRRLQQPGAFEQFLAGYIGRQYTRKQRGERGDRLCRCSDPICPLSKGNIPPQLQSQSYDHFGTASGRQRVTEYLQANPHAVVVREALDEWDRMAAEVERELREAHADVLSYRRGDYDEAGEFREGVEA